MNLSIAPDLTIYRHVSPPSTDFMNVPKLPTAYIVDELIIFTQLRVLPVGRPVIQYHPFTSCCEYDICQKIYKRSKQ
jgi:hypothetical protein